jgi:hypothetical protein
VQPLQWSKEKKFTIRTRLHSSIYSQDTHLNKFLNNYWREGVVLIDSVRELHSIDHNICIRFFPVIFNALFGLISRESEDESKAAFYALIILLKK